MYHGGVNYKKARLCMYGTTALVALVDPEQENLWLANLGDCQASMSLLCTYPSTIMSLKKMVVSHGLSDLCRGLED